MWFCNMLLCCLNISQFSTHRDKCYLTHQHTSIESLDTLNMSKCNEDNFGVKDVNTFITVDNIMLSVCVKIYVCHDILK